MTLLKDIMLDEYDDIKIINGDFVLVGSSAQVRQHASVVFSTFLGEYFLDTRRGVPYIQKIFKKGTTRQEMQDIFSTAALTVPGVLYVISVAIKDIDPVLRTAKVIVEAKVEGDDIVDLTYNVAPARNELSIVQDTSDAYDVWQGVLDGDTVVQDYGGL
jgi:hypothetical protein